MRRSASAAGWVLRWSSRLAHKIRVTRRVLATIVAHAKAESPHECCGLLIGTPDSVMRAVPTANVAADPTRRYEIAPADYLKEIKRSRAEDLAVVGAYHSHPASPPEPSPTDVAEAFSDFLFVIAGQAGPGMELRAYQLKDRQLERVVLQPV